MSATNPVCKACGNPGAGNYCSNCGQTMKIKRLSLHELLHEVFHFFTHVEKGILYTFKMLATSPGKMQKRYLDGDRVRHQKPFSMFFICGTISALIYYWVNTALIRYMNAGSVEEANFFQKYWALMQVCMLPVYALITYLFFKKAGYNFGEIAVFQLYVFSFLFIVLALIQLLKFIFPHLQTRYIELPMLIIYTLITNFNFFTRMKKTTNAIISVVCICVTFAIAAKVQDEFIKLIYR